MAGSSSRPRVVVAGGGVTGLAAAYRLRTSRVGGAAPAVTVLEASPGVGGKLRTQEVAGALVETGPDSFVLRKPAAADLCKELGLGEDLLVPAASGAYVWARGRLVEFPAGSAFGIPSSLESISRWPGLSARGRAAAAMDLWRGVPREARDAADESAAGLVTRRLGPEAADVLVLPVLAGIHAADPGRMSIAATFPELRAWEAGYGSLIRGAKAARRSSAKGAAPPPLFASLDGGLDRLASALAGSVGAESIRSSSPVERIEAGDDGAPYAVVAAGTRHPADAVVVATPAAAAASALAALAPAAAAAARELRTASTATVTLVYPRGTEDRLPDATGFLVPVRAGRAAAPAPAVITACTWLSRKWPDDSFAGRAVVRCFVGRDGEQDALALDDEELARAVAADVEATTPVGAAPAASLVTRWPDGMPQYDVGHLDRVGRVEAALASAAPGVVVAGAPYRGVGIADCVRQGNEAAEAVLGRLVEAAGGGSGRNPGNGSRGEEAAWTT